MTSTASETFQQLVQKLYHSHLNFYLTETPYSAQIVIRKRFLKDTNGPSPSFSPTSIQTEEVDRLHNQVLDLQKTAERLNKTIESLESKKAQAEAQAVKTHEIKTTEISVLKNSYKKSEDTIKALKKDLDDKQKDVKGKEKIIHELELKCENLITNIKNHKAELTKVKKENKKLLKHKTKTDQQFSSDSNQNIRAKAYSDHEKLSSSIGGIAPVSISNTSSSSDTPCLELLDTTAVKLDYTAVASAWPSSSPRGSGPSTPPCNPPLPDPTSDSPRTPPVIPKIPACSENQTVVENDSLESKKVKRKSLLSEEVQEILKNDKLDFAKLVEAVRNNKLPSDLLENDDDEFNYEEYPDEYCNIHDVTDEAIENDVTNEDESNLTV